MWVSVADLDLGKKRAKELLGVEPFHGNQASAYDYYHADDIHKLLGDGVEQYWRAYTSTMARLGVHSDRLCQDTHTGLLIGAKEILPKAREEELEEVIREMLSCERWNGVGYISTTTFDKAKALLERK